MTPKMPDLHAEVKEALLAHPDALQSLFRSRLPHEGDAAADTLTDAIWDYLTENYDIRRKVSGCQDGTKPWLPFSE